MSTWRNPTLGSAASGSATLGNASFGDTSLGNASIGKATLDQLRGLFSADLAKGRFQVVVLARRHIQSAETLVRTHAILSYLFKLTSTSASALTRNDPFLLS